MTTCKSTKLQKKNLNLKNNLDYECFLSTHVFEIINEQYGLPSTYQKGTLVNLISGINENDEPGHHPDEEYVTVCRVDSMTVEHIGILKRDLQISN